MTNPGGGTPFDWMEEAGKKAEEEAEEYSRFLDERSARIDEAYKRSLDENSD